MKTIKKYQWLFSFCMAVAFAGRYFHQPIFYWIAGGIFLSGLFIPFLREAISWSWKKFIEIIGQIISGIILTLVFFILITPLSLVRRLFGNATMKSSAGKNSNFISREHLFSKGEFHKTW